MSTITRERAQEIFLGNGPEPTASEERELARIALASLEAEPVGEVVLGEYDDCGCHPDARVACIAADGQADWENFKDGTRLYTAPPAAASAPDFGALTKCIVQRLVDYGTADDEAIASAEEFVYNACRAAMLRTRGEAAQLLDLEAKDSVSGPGQSEPVSQRDELPEGYCIMPMKLTAENGAKGALSGEFSETKFINCPECFGDDECETCDGSGRLEITVPVSWTTIKAIWAKGVEHFSAAPQQEVKS